MEEKIYNILHSVRPEYDFRESEDFIQDGLLDSFDVVTVVDEIENVFGIMVDGLDVLPENFISVKHICDLIEKNGGK